MQRRFAVRYEELLAEAEVKPEALEGVLERLDEFVQPFAASLKHPSQREHAGEYLAGLVSHVKRKNIEMLREHPSVLPHAWVTGDDEMGRNSGFRDELRGTNEQYLLAVPSHTLVRDLAAAPPPYCGSGKRPKVPFQRADG